MALVRWDPFREIDDVQREMNRLFDRLAPSATATLAPRDGGSAFIPAAELHENGNTFTLKLELPGLDVADLDIQATSEAVSVRGERRSEAKTEDQEKGVTRTEFRYGRFQRVIPLPSPVQQDKVQADYKDGILNLTLPKVENEKAKVVKVNLG